VECLSGSGAIASAYCRAFREGFTITLVRQAASVVGGYVSVSAFGSPIPSFPHTPSWARTQDLVSLVPPIPPHPQGSGSRGARHCCRSRRAPRLRSRPFSIPPMPGQRPHRRHRRVPGAAGATLRAARRPAHHPHRLCCAQQAARARGVHIAHAAGRAQGAGLLFLSRVLPPPCRVSPFPASCSGRRSIFPQFFVSFLCGSLKNS
jgi:hypothetical protein